MTRPLLHYATVAEVPRRGAFGNHTVYVVRCQIDVCTYRVERGTVAEADRARIQHNANGARI